MGAHPLHRTRCHDIVRIKGDVLHPKRRHISPPHDDGGQRPHRLRRRARPAQTVEGPRWVGYLHVQPASLLPRCAPVADHCQPVEVMGGQVVPVEHMARRTALVSSVDDPRRGIVRQRHPAVAAGIELQGHLFAKARAIPRRCHHRLHPRRRALEAVEPRDEDAVADDLHGGLGYRRGARHEGVAARRQVHRRRPDAGSSVQRAHAHLAVSGHRHVQPACCAVQGGANPARLGVGPGAGPHVLGAPPAARRRRSRRHKPVPHVEGEDSICRQPWLARQPGGNHGTSHPMGTAVRRFQALYDVAAKPVGRGIQQA